MLFCEVKFPFLPCAKYIKRLQNILSSKLLECVQNYLNAFKKKCKHSNLFCTSKGLGIWLLERLHHMCALQNENKTALHVLKTHVLR